MTTLAITPNWKNKSAKFKGTVATGEHVSVTIQNDDGEGGEFIADASTLRLRVVNPCNGRTLAIFPEPVPEGETLETWDSDLSPLRCTLNLNTVQMLKAVPPAANVSLLWVLDDYDNNTLYFKEQFPVEHWPRLRGEEEPTDLDNYKDIIADFNTRLDGYDTRITGAENAAQAATANASAAAAKANQAVGIANQAVDKAETAQNSAAASAEAAHNSALAAEEAQEAAESAAESINSPDASLTEEGVAADAKATGEAIAAEESRAKAAEAAEKARAEGVESGLDTRLTAAEKAIDDEAVLRAAAISNLSANKADKATTYTKTEVDTKIAGVQTFQKYLVQTLPDADEADMKGLYLVPTGETTEEGDLCEEWTVVEEDGEKRWEKIGGTTVDLSDYYDKDAVDNLLDDKQDALTFDNAPTTRSNNPVKSGGIWSAIWGALSALPTGFASLYDWAVAQLGLKRDYTDLSYDTTETIEVPALHATMTSQQGGQVIVEYNLLCTEEVPDPPQIGHTYTWRADGAVFYVTQGVSALQTTWILYSQNGEALDGITTQNATQGFYPDVDFRPSGAVITIHKTTAQKQVAKEDTIALESKTVPASRTVNGKALSSDVTLTGADVAVSGSNPTKIDAALAGKANRAANPTAGNLAALTATEDLEDSGYKATDFVEKGAKNILIGSGASKANNVTNAVVIGVNASANGSTTSSAVAIGTGAKAKKTGAIQLGVGENSVSNSLKFRNTVVVDGNGKIPSANLDVEVAEKSDIPYALVEKTPDAEGAVTLDDRADNYIDARNLGSSDFLDIDFPALVDGKSRDFVLAVECGANPPTISYAAFVTIMAEDASALAPEAGMNFYSFTEFKTNMFIAARKLITTVVDNSPENGDQLLLAMQKRGIDTTNITDFGGVETALGLSDTNTPQDAVNAVMS